MVYHWITVYEVILLIYGLSLTGHIIDFLKTNWHIKQVSLCLLWLAWVLQTVILVMETIQTNTLPVITLVDVLYVYVWLLLTTTLIIHHTSTIQFVELCTNVFAFVMLALAIGLDIKQQGGAQSYPLIHEVLIAHISFTVLAYVSFTISFFLSLMYLVQDWLLRKKKGIQWIWRFTNLNKLDTYSFLAILIGVPFLAIGLLLGFVWASISGAEFYWLDVKTIGSLALLLIYIIYVVLRVTSGYKGKPISLYNAATFLMLLSNIFLFSILSDFHF